MPRKSRTPAQEKRAQLATHIQTRGQQAYNIWVVRPPFESSELYLPSDSAMELYYFIEGEPSFKDISYAPLSSGARAARGDDWHFANVVTVSGESKAVYAKRGKQTQVVDNAVRVDLATLTSHAMRTENWRRIIPRIRRVRLHSIAGVERALLTVLGDGQPRSIRQVIKDVRAANPLSIGAVATQLRMRNLTSDCDTRPWSWNTLLRAVNP